MRRRTIIYCGKSIRDTALDQLFTEDMSLARVKSLPVAMMIKRVLRESIFHVNVNNVVIATG